MFAAPSRVILTEIYLSVCISVWFYFLGGWKTWVPAHYLVATGSVHCIVSI